MRELLARFFGELFPNAKAYFGYGCCEVTPGGAFLLWTDDKREDACISLPGSVCRSISPFDLLAFMHLVRGLVFRCSRLDVAFHDYARTISPRELADHCRRGSCSGYRVFRLHEGFGGNGGTTGDTLEMGRRGKSGSGSMYCVYDKLLESGDESMNCIRWEFRMFKKLAWVGFSMLCDATDVDALGAKLGELVGGGVDFIDRTTGDKNLDRCDRLPFWVKLLEILGRVKLSRPRVEPKLERSIEVLKQQHAPTIASIAEAYAQLGGDFYELVADLLVEGAGRMGRKHHALIEQYVTEVRTRATEVAA